MSRTHTGGLFVLGTLLFGTAFPAVKTGLSFILLLFFAAGRNYLAAVLLLTYVAATREYWTPRTRQDWVAVLTAGAFGFVSYLTLMGQVGALKANLVTYLIPLVALVVGWSFLGERLQPVALVGFAVIVAGFALLESRKIDSELAKYRGAFR